MSMGIKDGRRLRSWTIVQYTLYNKDIQLMPNSFITTVGPLNESMTEIGLFLFVIQSPKNFEASTGADIFAAFLLKKTLQNRAKFGGFFKRRIYFLFFKTH